jgi:DNA transformation protein and related proteins
MTRKADTQPSLADLPNIGPQVVRLLTSAGVHSPRELKNLGAVKAALRIAALRPADPPCRSMLAGLEGAIRGIRWHAIPKPDREALWKDYQTQLLRLAKTV